MASERERWEVKQTEWSMEDPAPWHIDENGVLICFGMNEDTARTIAHEHNCHEALVERVEALEKLLVCYRIGRHPSQKLLHELDMTVKAMALVKEGKALARGGDDGLAR